MRVAGLHQLKRPLTKLANPCTSGGLFSPVCDLATVATALALFLLSFAS